MNGIAFRTGVASGVVLGACVIVLAILGLTPSLSWIPEAPLVGVAVLLPLAVCGLTGFRVGLRDGRVAPGAVAGALAGSIGGVVGGMCYVLFGKPLLNIAGGLLLGSIGGGAAGAAGALLSRSAPRESRDHPSAR